MKVQSTDQNQRVNQHWETESLEFWKVIEIIRSNNKKRKLELSNRSTVAKIFISIDQLKLNGKELTIKSNKAYITSIFIRVL